MASTAGRFAVQCPHAPPSAGAREVLLVRAAHGAYSRSKRFVGPLTPRVRSVRGSDNTSLDPARGSRPVSVYPGARISLPRESTRRGNDFTNHFRQFAGAHGQVS